MVHQKERKKFGFELDLEVKFNLVMSEHWWGFVLSWALRSARVFKAVGSSEATCRTGVPKIKQFLC